MFADGVQGCLWVRESSPPFILILILIHITVITIITIITIIIIIIIIITIIIIVTTIIIIITTIIIIIITIIIIVTTIIIIIITTIIIIIIIIGIIRFVLIQFKLNSDLWVNFSTYRNVQVSCRGRNFPCSRRAAGVGTDARAVKTSIGCWLTIQSTKLINCNNCTCMHAMHALLLWHYLNFWYCTFPSFCI